MRWAVSFFAACVPRVPADPLPEAPPPLDAADYATEPLGAASALQRMAIANLQLGATADGVGVESDDRLSRVASRIAWEYERSETLPSTAIVQQLAADAGAPYVVPVVAVQVRARREAITTDLYALHGRSVPGSGPLAAGVGAYEVGDDTVLVLVLTRRGFWLSAPVARHGAAVVPLVGAFDSPAYGLLAVDAQGVHLTTAPSGEGRTASPPVPVQDGWVEVLAVDGPRSTALGLLRLGEPVALPEPDPAAADPVASGVERLRAAWDLGPLRLVDGVPTCDEVVDEVGDLEVTRDQACVTVPVTELQDPWGALAQRPLVLRAIADPDAELLQLGVDAHDGLVTVRTLRPFRRRSTEQATAELAALIEARWPGIRRSTDSPFAELARGWALSADPALSEGELGTRADDVAARWVGSGGWMRVLAASQHLERLLDLAKPESPPVGYAIGVAVGVGPEGEPLYYAAVGFRL